VRCHPPPRITWLKDDVPVQGSSRHQQSELADGVCRLIISNPEATTDSGQYTCRAENNVWSSKISSVVQFSGTKDFCGHAKGSSSCGGTKVTLCMQGVVPPVQVPRSHYM